MATERQRRANRRNAQRSTGPRTPAGRAVSSRNATRHGVLSAQVVVADGESAEEFNALREGLQQEFTPEGVVEATLVDQLAILIWRNRRLAASERALLNTRLAATNAKLADVDVRVERLERGLSIEPADQAMLELGEQLLIGRYQVMLTNQMMSIIQTLRRAVAEREGRAQ